MLTASLFVAILTPGSYLFCPLGIYLLTTHMLFGHNYVLIVVGYYAHYLKRIPYNEKLNSFDEAELGQHSNLGI